MATIEKEIDAIRALLEALEPLSPEARSNVLEYVLKRLSIQLQSPVTLQSQPATVSGRGTVTPASAGTHIEHLKEQKKPRSANEMAALVAYYLAEVAPDDARKETVNTKDIRRYFKIAQFPLPGKPEYTLQNARTAGYFDAVGEGEYRLNPVGYNLVVHSMPRGGGEDRPKKSKKKRKAGR